MQIHIRRPQRPSSSVTSKIGKAGGAATALTRLRRGLMLNDVLGEWEEQAADWYHDRAPAIAYCRTNHVQRLEGCQAVSTRVR